MKLIISKKILLKIAGLLCILLLIENTAYEYSQYYFLALFSSVTVAAFLTGFTWLLLSVGYWVAPRIKRFQILLIMIALLMVIAGLWQSQLAIIVFCLMYPLLAIVENGIQGSIQHNITSDVRASASSTMNFIGNLVLVPFTLVFAYIIDTYSTQTAYVIAGVFFALCGLYYAFDKLIHTAKITGEPTPIVNEYRNK
jgi:hypothetical protein